MKIISSIVLCALSGFAQQPQTNCVIPGSIGWWRAEGNALDSVGTNPGVWLNGEAYAAGKVGQAFDLNGFSAMVEVADAPELRFTNAMTFEGWIYPRSVGGGRFHEIVSKWEGGTEDQRSYTITIYPDGRFVGSVSSDGGPITTAAFSADVIPVDTWTHVAFVYDGTAASSYINGQVHSVTPSTAGIFPGRVPLVIGSTLQSGSFFDGLIDEPALYNRALSPSEISAIYDAGSAGKNGPPLISSQPQNQVGYWGQSATFSVTAVGGNSLSYQWSKGGTPIDGATDSSLVLPKLQAGDAGTYSVTVSNSCGSTPSSNAVLTVNPAGVSLALYAGISISGVPGYTYGIQYTTDLSNTNGWQGIANVTLSTAAGFWLDQCRRASRSATTELCPGRF